MEIFENLFNVTFKFKDLTIHKNLSEQLLSLYQYDNCLTLHFSDCSEIFKFNKDEKNKVSFSSAAIDIKKEIDELIRTEGVDLIFTALNKQGEALYKTEYQNCKFEQAKTEFKYDKSNYIEVFMTYEKSKTIKAAN